MGISFFFVKRNVMNGLVVFFKPETVSHQVLNRPSAVIDSVYMNGEYVVHIYRRKRYKCGVSLYENDIISLSDNTIRQAEVIIGIADNMPVDLLKNYGIMGHSELWGDVLQQSDRVLIMDKLGA